MEEDNVTSDGEMEEGELKEDFAAGWKAKQKVADLKKNRGWKTTDKKGECGQQTIDARKKATTSSSISHTRRPQWSTTPTSLPWGRQPMSSMSVADLGKGQVLGRMWSCTPS